jgi:hypothetical protein
MKKKLNYWIIYFFLTVGISLLLNGGIFAGPMGDISLSRGGMGSIKLSGKTSTTPIRSKNPIVQYQFRKHSGQVNWTSAQQKGEK